jgi:hypothetical protein
MALATLADTQQTPAPPADARITLGIPSRGTAASHTTRTLLDMALWDSMYGRGWLRHDKPAVWVIGASLITNARNTLVEQFLALPDEPEWLLFLDDDQTYPADLLEHLTLAVEEVERQTKASCLTMTVPVWRFDGKGRDDVRSVHNVFDADDDLNLVPHEGITDGRVIQVAAIGTGCFMVHRYALERLRQVSTERGLGHEHCWFRHVVHPKNEGEDLYFCRLLSAAGIPLWTTTTAGTLGHLKTIIVDREFARGSVTV